GTLARTGTSSCSTQPSLMIRSAIAMNPLYFTCLPLKFKTITHGWDDRSYNGKLIRRNVPAPIILEEDRVGVFPAVYVVERNYPGSIQQLFALVISFDDECNIQPVIIRHAV